MGSPPPFQGQPLISIFISAWIRPLALSYSLIFSSSFALHPEQILERIWKSAFLRATSLARSSFSKASRTMEIGETCDFLGDFKCKAK